MIFSDFDVVKMMEVMERVFFSSDMQKEPPNEYQYAMMLEAIKPFHENYFKHIQNGGEEVDKFKVFRMFSVSLLHFGILCGMEYMKNNLFRRTDEQIH